MINKTEINTSIYLASYSFTFLCLGLHISSIGSLIPYLSQQRNVHETAYAYLFIAGAAGSIIVIIISKGMHPKSNYHKQHRIIIAGSILFAIFQILFVSQTSKLVECISMAVFGGATYLLNTALSTCLLLISKERSNQFMAYAHGLFGTGALLSPLVIRFLGADSYYYFAILFLINSLFLSFLPSPQYIEQSKSEKQLDFNKFKIASFRLSLLFCLAFFCLVGIESSVSGWFSSYAVISGISNKAEATIYSTIFWATVTIFKFVTTILPFTVTIKLKIHLISLLISGALCLILQQIKVLSFTILFGSFSFGLSCSSIFSLLLLVSIQYGIRFNKEQFNNMMATVAFASGILTGASGTLMRWKVQTLFYWLLLMSVGLWITLKVIFEQMQTQSNLDQISEFSSFLTTKNRELETL